MANVNKLAEKSFTNDFVQKWTPVTFSVEFTTRMRKKNPNAYPSIRTSIAIPKFLTARYMRKYSLYPADYVDAAVYNSPYEDQKLALVVAREILFPKEKKKKENKSKSDTATKGSIANNSSDDSLNDDPLSMIMDDLANLDFNIDDIDNLTDLSLTNNDSLENNGGLLDFKAFELYEQLLESENQSDRSLAELLQMFGGPSQMEALDIKTEQLAREFVSENLQSTIGQLTPEHIFHGSEAGFSDVLTKETSLPWEYSASLLGSHDLDKLRTHLQESLESISARDLGKIIKYFQPFKKQLQNQNFIDEFGKKSFDKIEDLMDHASIIDGLDEWITPSDKLIQSSVKENMAKSFQAGSWMDNSFNTTITESIVDTWIKQHQSTPKPSELLDYFANTSLWKDIMNNSLQNHFQNIQSTIDTKSGTMDSEFSDEIAELTQWATKLEEKQIPELSKFAKSIANNVLTTIQRKEQYLPIMDDFIEKGIQPSNVEGILQHAKALGFDQQEILERFGDAFKQLQAMISSLTSNPDRYNSLLNKINTIPKENYVELAKFCEQNDFKEGMASLLAINMGMALQSQINNDFIADSINYKGIGGGENLLKEWFSHRHSFKGKLREKIKELAKDALVDLSLEWRNKGSGSVDKGIIPQTRIKPFRSGDDLDQLDIEGTLTNIISAGKTIDQITEEDLFVHDTSKGQSAITILLDISGSMSGQDLAMCAITSVMLLGKLHPDEIALALFESDTHVIKNFTDERDLDEVANELLELTARGGTRIDQALQWATHQFEESVESEFRLLFILSDFCVAEKPADVKKYIEVFYDLNVKYLGASHGYYCQGLNEALLDYLEGYSTKLKSLKELPSILTEAIDSIGDSGFTNAQ